MCILRRLTVLTGDVNGGEVDAPEKAALLRIICCTIILTVVALVTPCGRTRETERESTNAIDPDGRVGRVLAS